jgi:acyl carrier protein
MNRQPTEETLRQWLMEHLSKTLKTERARLDPDAPFARYGLNSLDAVTLVMDLEDELGVELPPTLLWDHPTINKCAAHLATLRVEAAVQLDAQS